MRYNLPVAPAEIEVSQETFDAATKARNESADVEVEVEAAGEEAPRSSRPGQRGFAARYMANQGWKKGEGLGASGSGIVDALRVQVEKRKKRSDADGGGFVGPGGKGKIVGGKKKPGTEEDGKFGKMNEVIVARGMLTGMDVDAEIENGLLQELGEECEAKVSRGCLAMLRFCLCGG